MVISMWVLHVKKFNLRNFQEIISNPFDYQDKVILRYTIWKIKADAILQPNYCLFVAGMYMAISHPKVRGAIY